MLHDPLHVTDEVLQIRCGEGVLREGAGWFGLVRIGSDCFSQGENEQEQDSGRGDPGGVKGSDRVTGGP